MTGELAGRLRARVEIARRGGTRDVLGGAAGSWVTLGAVWAELVPAEPGDAVAGDARSAAARWRVTLRAGAGADVAIGDRLLWRERRLRVRRRIEDPATPDRLVVETEEER